MGMLTSDRVLFPTVSVLWSGWGVNFLSEKDGQERAIGEWMRHYEWTLRGEGKMREKRESRHGAKNRGACALVLGPSSRIIVTLPHPSQRPVVANHFPPCYARSVTPRDPADDADAPSCSEPCPTQPPQTEIRRSLRSWDHHVGAPDWLVGVASPPVNFFYVGIVFRGGNAWLFAKNRGARALVLS